MIRKINKKIQHYILLSFGFILFLLFIWFRFIRTRLPRDIPFHPKFLGLMLLIFICASYSYRIIVIYRKPKRPNKAFSTFITILFNPLTLLDDAIKTAMSETLRSYFLDKWWKKFQDPKRLIIIYNILPRIVLLSILYLDVFFFSKLHYIYKIVFLTLFPLFARYRKYSLRKFVDNEIALLSLDIDYITTPYIPGVHPSEWPENLILMSEEEREENEYDGEETMSLPLDVFINYQSSLIVNSQEPIDSNISISKLYHAEYQKKFNIKRLMTKDLQYVDTILQPKIERLIELTVTLQNYNNIAYEDKQMKLLKTLIYLNYFICWFYILIISLPHAHWDQIITTFLHTLTYELEPFSHTYIFY